MHPEAALFYCFGDCIRRCVDPSGIFHSPDDTTRDIVYIVYPCALTSPCDVELACREVAQASLARACSPQLLRRDRRPTSVTAAMSVLLETSLGDITIDLLVDDAPKCCEK